MTGVVCWLREWDWRPLARLAVWSGLAVAAARYHGLALPDPAALLRELLLGWLLSFGLLTWIQLHLIAAAWCAYMTLDDWTYALAERLARSLAGRASFGVNFLAALCVQLALVLGSLALLQRVHAGPRLLALLDAGLRATFG